MTEQRFIIMDNLPKGTHSRIWDKQKQHNQGIGDELWLGEVVAMLNEGVILAEENEELKREIEDFQTLLASKEEICLKPVITMIDKKMEQCVLFEDNKCAVILSELKQELKGDVDD